MIGTTWGLGWDTPYNGLSGKTPPKRDTFLRFRYRKGQGFHKLKYMKGLTGVVYGCKKSKPMVLYEQYLKVMQR